MASGTISMGTSGRMEGRIVWSSTANGSTQNNSSVTATVQIRKTDTYTTTGTFTGGLNINGDNRTFSVHTSINSSWVSLFSFTITKSHNDNGTGSCFIASEVKGASGTTLASRTVYGEATVTLDTIQRYAEFSTQPQLKARTETTLDVFYKPDRTLTAVKYSVDGGSTWHNVTTIDGAWSSTEGCTIRISGLSAGTTYQVLIEIQAYNNGLWRKSNTISMATYNYPYVSAVETRDLIIGNSQKLTLYNPLSRTVTVQMFQNPTIYEDDISVFYSGTTNGTSITFTPNKTKMYQTIPNNASSTCSYSVTYGSSIKTTTGTYTYNIKSGECVPTAGSFAYQDTNSSVVAITESNQRIVRNQSTLRFIVGTATAKNSASISSYAVTFNNETRSRSSAGNIDFGTIDLTYEAEAILTVTDSRGQTVTRTINVIIDDWVTPTASAEIIRKNNYETESYITIKGDYSSVNGKNTMTLQYRYKETTSSTWGNWITVQDNTQVTINLDNTKAFNIQTRIMDKFATTVYEYALAIGMPIIFIDAETLLIGINKFPTSGGAKFQLDGDVDVDGEVSANNFVGDLTGRATNSTNSTNATNTNVTNTNPTSGTWYYPTFVTGTSGNQAHRVNDGLKYHIVRGSASNTGSSYLQLGNNIAKNTAGNQRARLRLYGDTAYYHELTNSPSANRNISLPDLAGVIPIRQSDAITTETNGWYKVNFGAFTMYYKNGEIASRSYNANGWGWLSDWYLPQGITFNSAKMVFSGCVGAGDTAVMFNCRTNNGTGAISISWSNRYSSAVNTKAWYNFMLIVFP